MFSSSKGFFRSRTWRGAALLFGAFFLLSCGLQKATVMDSTASRTDRPVGWRVPAVALPDQYGREVNLQKATSGPWAVVFFYPKADTPG